MGETMSEEEVVYRKTLTVGYDVKRHKVVLDVEIVKHREQKETVDHKQVDEYLSLSISGSSKEYGGQIIGMLTPENIPHLARKMTWEKLERIKRVWKRWHLNDTRPNCIHQDVISTDLPFDEWNRLAEIETQKCPQKYRYGSKWLVEILPEDVVSEVMSW
jgi:hypothetical protein